MSAEKTLADLKVGDTVLTVTEVVVTLRTTPEGALRLQSLVCANDHIAELRDVRKQLEAINALLPQEGAKEG